MSHETNGRPTDSIASILDSIDAAHARAVASLNEVLSTPSTPEVAAQRYPSIRAELLASIEAEQRVFYAACRDRLDDSFVIEHVSTDDAQIDALIRELDARASDSPGWLHRFIALRDAVDEHLEEVRAVLFPRCADAFEAMELARLDRAFDAVRREIAERLRGEAPRPVRPTRAHPRTPAAPERSEGRTDRPPAPERSEGRTDRPPLRRTG